MIFQGEGRTPGGGGNLQGFYHNLAPQCRTFSRAFRIEKLKAPLFPGPEGAGDTNDLCIIASQGRPVRPSVKNVEELNKTATTQNKFSGPPLAHLEKCIWMSTAQSEPLRKSQVAIGLLRDAIGLLGSNYFSMEVRTALCENVEEQKKVFRTSTCHNLLDPRTLSAHS